MGLATQPAALALGRVRVQRGERAASLDSNTVFKVKVKVKVKFKFHVKVNVNVKVDVQPVSHTGRSKRPQRPRRPD